MDEELKLLVPLGDRKETDLMAALEFVIRDHLNPVYPILHVGREFEVARAVKWLKAKYGSPITGGSEG